LLNFSKNKCKNINDKKNLISPGKSLAQRVQLNKNEKNIKTINTKNPSIELC